MARYKILKQVDIPIRHSDSQCGHDWQLTVRKYNRTCVIKGSDKGCDYIDKKVIAAIFLPHKDQIEAHFDIWESKGFVTSDSVWGDLGSIDTFINRIKDESIAIELINWLEWIVKKVLAAVYENDNTGATPLVSDTELCPSNAVRAFSESINNEVMQRFYLIGESLAMNYPYLIRCSVSAVRQVK